MRIGRMAPTVALALVLGAAPASAAETDVSIGGSAFQAAVVTVALGDAVRWTNEDGFGHTSTGKGPLNLWNLSIPSGDDKARSFVQAGAFGYLCTIHSGMTGTVKVPIKVTPASGSAATTFTVRVASTSAPSGFSYVIERKKPGGAFKPWKTTSAKSMTFSSSVVGTWSFRVKLKRTSTGATSGFSPVDTAVIS